jgi:DNA polymerase elongation subunit (family B)
MVETTLLYLFSVQVVSISSNRWVREPLLFFVDQHGDRHTYILRNYAPYILLRPDNASIEPCDVEKHLGDSVSIIRIEEHLMTPLVGFTNARKDRVFRLYYAEVGQKYRLMKMLEEMEVTILHRRFNDELHLLHITGWSLHSWFRLDGASYHKNFVDHGRSGSVKVEQLVPVSSAPMPIPPLSYAYIRLTIKSSTATATNLFSPDHTIAQDVIQACELRVGRLNSKEPLCTTVLTNTSEKRLLHDVHRWFVVHSPCILVHMSDPIEHLAFLHFRAKQHKCNPGLSAIRAISCIENRNMSDDSFRDLSCPGRETMDLLHVLQKFMISPKLDGYTLLDAFNHPKLIRSKEPLSYNGDIDVTLESMVIRQDFSHKELDVMCVLQSDNTFILSNLALSASCDLSLFQIISRGQQARAFACFARAYHKECIYINHDQFDRQYLLVKKRREDSSYPDPLWIDNPPLDTLRSGDPVDPGAPVTKKRRPTLLEVLGSKKRHKAEPSKPKTEKRFGGGFVIVPSPGFYHRWWEAVVTLDFASLYPSIMEGYRICFMRVCYDQRWIDDDRAEKEYVPLDNNTCCVFIKSYDGIPVTSITDKIVHDVVQNRKRVREEIKRTQDVFVKQSLDAQQLCCKILQNAFYGACGSETFAIPCNAIAASVCMIGQYMNKTVRHRAMIRGGRCVYGDTDSVMVQFRTDPSLVTRDDILADVYRQGHELETETSALFPSPNAVEFEALKLPHLQTSKKKTYAANEYPPGHEGWKKPYTKLFKGFAFKKRDRCPFVNAIGEAMMGHIMTNDLSDVAIVEWLAQAIDETFIVKPTEEQLGVFVITCCLNSEYKKENALALHLAGQYEKEAGVRPRPGRRLRYIIASFPNEQRKHNQSSVTPAEFIRSNHILDTAYYLSKQLLLSLKQVLDLRPALFTRIERMVARKVASKTMGKNRFLRDGRDRDLKGIDVPSLYKFNCSD